MDHGAGAEAANMSSKYATKKTKKKAKKRRKLLSSVPTGVVEEAAMVKESQGQHGDGVADGVALPFADGGGKASTSSGSSSKRKRSQAAGASGSDAKTNAHDGNTCPFPADACPADVLAWIVHPIPLETFFAEYWEIKPLLIKRKKANYWRGLFSSGALDRIFREQYVKFGVNIDLTTYTDGVRETHNPPGRAQAGTIWSHYKEGCSVRFLNPQTFHKPLHQLCATLQEYFNCMVGVNTYLTPPNSQGFSPHYDDIEAFILQVEGSKRWRLYDNPEGQALPRYSSRNFEQREIGGAVMDFVLNPGDMLYFPRGIVHQANVADNDHSLHITLSTYQRNTWGDLMTKVVQGALDVATEEDEEFRHGLPLDYLRYMGVSHSDDTTSKQRQAFSGKVAALLRKLEQYAPVDAAADQLGVQSIHHSMPPILTPAELALSSGGRNRRCNQDGSCNSTFDVANDSEIKLVRPGAARLVVEDGQAHLYHTLDNGLFYEAEVPQSVIFELDHTPALEEILGKPDVWLDVCTLPGLDAAAQTNLAALLYDIGIVLAREPDVEEL